VPGTWPSGSVLGARYPTLGHGRMRGKGDTTFPASFVQAEGRTPNPVPGTWYLALMPYFHISNKAVERILVSKPFIVTPSPCYSVTSSPRHSVTFTGEIPPDIFEQTPYELGQRRSPIGVPGIRSRVSGTWDLVPGTGAGPTPKAEYRAPNLIPAPEKPTHRVCILHPYRSSAPGIRFPALANPRPRTEGRIPNTEPGTRHLIAALPYCPTAVLPNCPTAQLPYCLPAPIALPFRPVTAGPP
jgi:hypothetical protein